jgi:hypothetical protein
MRRNKEQSNGGDFVTIATKVSKVEKERVKDIASAFNMSFYELLQSLLLALLRYFDSGSLVTYDHNCMMNALANTMYAINGSYNPLLKKGRENQCLDSAILFIGDNKKRRPQLLSISKNDDGQFVESLNFDKMVADFLKCVDPDAFMRLESKRVELGYFSITHTLHELIMQRTSKTDEIKDEIAGLFTDKRIPTGQAVNEDIFYQKRNKIHSDEYTTIEKKQTFRADIFYK